MERKNHRSWNMKSFLAKYSKHYTLYIFCYMRIWNMFHIYTPASLYVHQVSKISLPIHILNLFRSFLFSILYFIVKHIFHVGLNRYIFQKLFLSKANTTLIAVEYDFMCFWWLKWRKDVSPQGRANILKFRVVWTLYKLKEWKIS